MTVENIRNAETRQMQTYPDATRWIWLISPIELNYRRSFSRPISARPSIIAKPKPPEHQRMPSFVRTAQLRDLKEGATLFYGSHKISVFLQAEDGIFTGMANGHQAVFVDPNMIDRYQVECEPLRVVK